MKTSTWFGFACILGLAFISFRAKSQDTQTEQNQQQFDSKPGQTGFLLTGYGYSGFEQEGDNQGTFGPLGFSPIFLWKKSDKLFFESELEVEVEDGNTNIGLEYATLHYQFCKYLTFSAGKFLSPFGTFIERLHPAWINKFSEKPLGFSEEDAMVGPMSEFGVSLRGGANIGKSKINYVAYISNGPALNTGEDNQEEAGMLEYENLADNNYNKAVGGRLGFLPFSNSSLEIGASGQYALVGDRASNYSGIAATMLAGDFNYVNKISPLKSKIDIKGQYNLVNVDDAVYYTTDSIGKHPYTFTNSNDAYYAQLAFRPEYIKNKFFKNLEITGRYSVLETPENSLWGTNVIQYGIGLNYWFSWHAVIKIDELITQAKGEKQEQGFFVQFAMGF